MKEEIIYTYLNWKTSYQVKKWFSRSLEPQNVCVLGTRTFCNSNDQLNPFNLFENNFF